MNPLAYAAVQATRHAFMRFISVACVGLVLVGTGYAVYKQFIKPNEQVKTEQTNVIRQVEDVTIDQRQIHPVREDSFFFGIKLFGVKLGISTQGKVTPVPEIKNEMK